MDPQLGLGPAIVMPQTQIMYYVEATICDQTKTDALLGSNQRAMLSDSDECGPQPSRRSTMDYETRPNHPCPIIAVATEV